MTGLSPMSSLAKPVRDRNSLASASARTKRSVFSMTTSKRSVERGFSRKSIAPSLVALTAASTVAWPDIMSTGTSFFESLTCSKSWTPVSVGQRDIEQRHVVGALCESLFGQSETARDVHAVAFKGECLL